MGQQNDGFLGVVDHLIGQTWLIIKDQRHSILSRNVCRRDDDEFSPRNMRSKFHTEYFAARNFTPHRDAVDHSRKIEVVDVTSVAGDLIGTFFSWSCP